MSASHTLLVNGGPKGVLYNDYTDQMGNVALSSEDEKDIKDRFKRDYGLVNKEYPILVTRYKLGWLPLDFNADELKLHEEDKRCTDKIANAMGINANLFTDAKYDNLESAGKKAYQDVIIPDSRKIAECLSKAICPEGVFIKIDFTDVECLQTNKETEANTLVKVADALQRLIDKSLITHDEARIEVARYIDIDPDNPKEILIAMQQAVHLLKITSITVRKMETMTNKYKDKMGMQYKLFSINSKDVQYSPESRTISGYAAVFGNMDKAHDILLKGCFFKSINERGPQSQANDKIILLWMHDMSEPLGFITELKEDDRGLYFEARIDEIELGDRAIKQLESGTLNQFSIGYEYVWRIANGITKKKP